MVAAPQLIVAACVGHASLNASWFGFVSQLSAPSVTTIVLYWRQAELVSAVRLEIAYSPAVRISAPSGVAPTARSSQSPVLA